MSHSRPYFGEKVLKSGDSALENRSTVVQDFYDVCLLTTLNRPVPRCYLKTSELKLNNLSLRYSGNSNGIIV